VHTSAAIQTAAWACQKGLPLGVRCG